MTTHAETRSKTPMCGAQRADTPSNEQPPQQRLAQHDTATAEVGDDLSLLSVPQSDQADDNNTEDRSAGENSTQQRHWPRIGRAISSRISTPPLRAALLFDLFALIVVAGLLGWMCNGLHHQHSVDQQRASYLQVGRQGALNLTTIDWQHADADVQRILDSATGAFHDDFTTRAKDFIDVVKQTESHSEGSVIDAGVESVNPNGATILVAVNVKSGQAGQPEQRSRNWRMRIIVEHRGDTTKIANVEFVA